MKSELDNFDSFELADQVQTQKFFVNPKNYKVGQRLCGDHQVGEDHAVEVTGKPSDLAKVARVLVRFYAARPQPYGDETEGTEETGSASSSAESETEKGAGNATEKTPTRAQRAAAKKAELEAAEGK